MTEESSAITSVEEFVRLRTSSDPEEYGRAAQTAMPIAVWEELIRTEPDMRFWAAQNKTVPVEVLRELAGDDDARVRLVVARKRKATADILEGLAADPDDAVRMAVARHANTPDHVLLQLADDPWETVRAKAAERLHQPT